MLAPTQTSTDNRDNRDNVVHLTGILDVRSVGDVRQTLNYVIDSFDGDVIVDLEAVDAVGGPDPRGHPPAPGPQRGAHAPADQCVTVT